MCLVHLAQRIGHLDLVDIDLAGVQPDMIERLGQLHADLDAPAEAVGTRIDLQIQSVGEGLDVIG